MNNSKSKCNNRFLDTFIAKLFYSYGKFIGRHPIWFTVIPPIIAIIFALGLLLKSDVEITDVDELYAPYASPYKSERKAIFDRWPTDPEAYTYWSVLNGRITPQAILMARDKSNANMISLPMLEAAYRFNDHVMNVMKVAKVGKRSEESHSFTFKDVCMKFKKTCSYNNDHLQSIYNILKFEDEESRNKLTYPKARFGKNAPEVFLASGLGGVEIDDKSRLTFVKAIGLIYFIRRDGVYSEMSSDWELLYQETVEQYNANKSNPLVVSYVLSNSLDVGLRQNAEYLKPRFSITFGAMIIFAIICSFKLKLNDGSCPTIDVVASKPLLAVMGVITAVLGIVMAEGLLIYSRYNFNEIVETMPFLVLAIGVDDMFILLSAWRSTNPKDTVEERIGNTMSHSAVSITITSLTTAISFAVGLTTPIRAVQIFCLYSSLATVCNYCLQITFFVGIMTYSGRWEAEGRNSLCLCVKTTGKESFTNDENRQLLDEFIEKYYVQFITSITCKVLAVVVLACYLTFAILGALKLKEGLNVDKLMLRSFHGHEFYETARLMFWPQGLQVEVVVGKVPDLTEPKNRKAMNQIVRSFEDLSFTMNETATEYWMRDYLGDYPPPQNKSKDWTDRLQKWSKLATWEKKYSQAFTWKPATEDDINGTCKCKEVVDAFRFKLGFLNFQSTNNQKTAMIEMRQVAKHYAEYEVSSFMGEYPFMDQYLIILPTTLKNIGIAIVCMIVIALVFIPNPVCVIWIALTIASIDIGVIGYMTWWNVSLDTVSMVTIIMSIGFSVDYSAHITYGYISAKGCSRTRITLALQHLGWPVLQGAMSTVIGILVLASVDGYVVQTFFKTVLLVIVFGAVHACFILPVMLVTSDEVVKLVCSGKSVEQQKQIVYPQLTPGSPISSVSSKV